ncbi:MAG: PQQ-like beta-propeller repeat protein [Verrucomicrobiaceae bacterium]|nr:PQQ-like beta-propeller repeat protein [Verrucomicrobiaceae bacterium]
MRPARFFLLCIVLTASLHAADWPQWRGPSRDGVWSETGIISSFTSQKLTPLWSAPVGAGYNGPTVAGDRVFVMDRVAQPEQQERVLCLDRTTGKVLWTHAYACEYRDFGYPLGPRAAVTIEAGRAFSLGAMGHLFGLDAATGRVLWSHDLKAEFNADIPLWGIASAPLVAGDLVIVQAAGRPDACMMAFDATTGKEKWRALDGKGSYSAPKLIGYDGHDVVLAFTGNWLAALEPETGRVIWSLEFKPAKMPINVPDAVLDESGRHLFATTFYDGSFYFGMNRGASPPDLLWRRQGVSERKTEALHCMIMTPLLRDGHIYGIDSYGEFRCLDAKTGDRVWSDESLLANGRWATAYFVQNGDRTWITTEKGEIIIARLTPEGFERISSAQLITPTTELRGRNHPIDWSHPAFAHRCVFARNDREIICVSLAAESR